MICFTYLLNLMKVYFPYLPKASAIPSSPAEAPAEPDRRKAKRDVCSGSADRADALSKRQAFAGESADRKKFTACQFDGMLYLFAHFNESILASFAGSKPHSPQRRRQSQARRFAQRQAVPALRSSARPGHRCPRTKTACCQPDWDDRGCGSPRNSAGRT